MRKSNRQVTSRMLSYHYSRQLNEGLGKSMEPKERALQSTRPEGKTGSLSQTESQALKHAGERGSMCEKNTEVEGKRPSSRWQCHRY